MYKSLFTMPSKAINLTAKISAQYLKSFVKIAIFEDNMAMSSEV